MRRWWRAVGLAGAVTMVVAVPGAQAASVYDEQGELIRASRHVAVHGPDLFGDRVSLYQGALEFVQTDVSLPGNSALPVAVGRRLTTGALAPYLLGHFGRWDLELPRIHGIFATRAGWVTDGTVKTARCSDFRSPPVVGGSFGSLAEFDPSEYWRGTHLYVPGVGDQEVLVRMAGTWPVPADGLSYPLVTTGKWMIGCLPGIANPSADNAFDRGEGFQVLAPDGTRYRFDWMVRRTVNPVTKSSLAAGLALPSGSTSLGAAGLAAARMATPGIGLAPTASATNILQRSEYWMLPTWITDRHGNTVALQYDPSRPWRLLTMTASDGRRLTFSYAATGDRISAVTDGTRTWQYGYDATGDLSEVTLPDRSNWTFTGTANIARGLSYSVGPGCDDPGKVSSMAGTATFKHPSGAVGSFTIAPTLHARSLVPRDCINEGTVILTTSGPYPRYPKFFTTYSLTQKTITGPGLPAYTWTYAYSNALTEGSWSTCTGTCPVTKTVTVQDARGHVSRHTFGTRHGVTDGQLLKLEEGVTGGTALRTTEFGYRGDPGGAFPREVGFSMLDMGDTPMSLKILPQDRRVVTQQGVQFSWIASAFDIWARPVAVARSSSLGASRTELTARFDHLGKWVLGQVASVSEASTGLVPESHTYDAATALRTSSRAFGLLQANFVYHPDGTLAGKSDPAGRFTYFGSYKLGIPQSVTYPDGTSESAGINDLGLVAWHTNPAGTTTSYGYDAMGRLSAIQPPAESTGPSTPTALALSPAGAPAFGLPAGHWRQTVVKGNAVSVRYLDALWREVVRWDYDAADVANTQRTTLLRWDADGRKTFENHPVATIGSVADVVPGRTWTFDAIGRPVSQVEDSELGPLVTQTNHLAGFLKQVVNPRGHATVYGHQAFDTPGDAAITSIAAPEGVNVAIPRDVFGKALSITRGGITRRYAYDANQRLCKTVEPESGATVRAYDGAGNLAWTASGLALAGPSCDQALVPDARKISHSYDALNRLVLTRHGDGSPSFSRQYTADGLLSYVGAETTSWVYAYNNRREMVVEQFTGELTQHVMRWNRNGNGDVASLQQDGQASLDFSPDAFGRPRQISGHVSGIRYHPNGAVAGYTLANGVVFSQSLNVRGLPAGRRDLGVTWDSIAWDANGNVSSIADLQTGSTHNRAMAYDGLDRLVAATGTWGTASFVYDAADNLRSSTVGARSLVHNIDANNRLTSLTGSQNIAMSYDANGNLLSRGAQTYRFSIANRMLHADGIVSYAYDGYGRRAIFSYPNGDKQFHAYDRDGRLRFASHSRLGVTRYVYLGDKLIAETNSIIGTNFVHTDALGSPVARTNTSGQLSSRTRYEPYGGTVAGSTNPTGIGFTGHVNDAATGLVYMQQRYFDSICGCFLSPDPIPVQQQDGMLFGRYSYANNNPFRYSDRDGRLFETIWDVGSLILSVGQFLQAPNLTNAIGVAIDSAAVLVPGIPGGVGAMRAAGKSAEGVGDIGLVIGRKADLATPGSLSSSEKALTWEAKPDTKSNWKENSSQMREAMAQGRPIRDASPTDKSGAFLQAERNLLDSRGWTFDSSTSFWLPPKK